MYYQIYKKKNKTQLHFQEKSILIIILSSHVSYSS